MIKISKEKVKLLHQLPAEASATTPVRRHLHGTVSRDSQQC